MEGAADQLKQTEKREVLKDFRKSGESERGVAVAEML